MIREFSVVRRRPNLVDVVTPRRPGVDGYRLEWATNFDATYTTLFTASLSGHVDDSLRDAGHTMMAGDNVRMIFDPANYAMVDSKAFWLRFVPVTGGAPGTATPGVLILPDQGGFGTVIIAGNAPNVAAVANSTIIHFPRLVEDLRIVNNSDTNALMVAALDSDAEYTVKGGATQQILANLRGATSGIRVRGSGAIVAFQATFTLAYAR